jgi:hypothetical protein
VCLCTKQASTTSGLDLLFRQSGKVFCLDNDGNGDLSISEQFEDTLGNQVDDRSLSSAILGSLIDALSSNVEKLVKVASRVPGAIAHQVKVTHTDLSEITRVILIHHNTVMVLSTSVTATTRVMTVTSDTTVTGGDVTALFPVLVISGRHIKETAERRERGYCEKHIGSNLDWFLPEIRASL